MTSDRKLERLDGARSKGLDGFVFECCDLNLTLSGTDGRGTLVRLRKVDVRLPGKGNSHSHGARLVHLIITMIKWIRTSRLTIKNSLS